MQSLIILIISVVIARRVHQQGQLVSRNMLPIGAELQIQFDTMVTTCNTLGYFTINGDQFTINVLQQFQQQFYRNTNNIYVIDNNITIIAQMSGTILNSNQQPIMATIGLNFSNPLNLGYIEVKSNDQGYFNINQSLMQLMIYEVTVIIISPGYATLNMVVSLYDQYIHDFGNIMMRYSYVEGNILIKVVNNKHRVQATSECALYGYPPTISYATTDSDGILHFINKYVDVWPYTCVVYTFNVQSVAFQLHKYFDGRNDSNYYIQG